MTTIEDVLAHRARWCVVHGESPAALEPIPKGAVHALVTDPPSGISFMGTKWDHGRGGRAAWTAWLADILGAARARVRNGGRALVWSLPRTSHWTGCAVEDANWTIETTVSHLFGTGWPKAKSQLKPAHETWWLARTGRSLPLNLDECRVGCEPGDRADRTGGTAQKWSRVYAQDAWSRAVTGSISPAHVAGRWPPSLVLTHAVGCICHGVRKVRSESGGPIVSRASGSGGAQESAIFGGDSRSTASSHPQHHSPDGMETVAAWACVEGCPVLELDRQSGVTQSSNHRRKNVADNRVYGASQGPRTTGGLSDEGTASRFFPQFEPDDPHAPWNEALFQYIAKPSQTEKHRGLEGTNDHPTVKPVAFMRWLIRLVSHPGDIILDTFGGSGTTGVAALLEARRVILIEGGSEESAGHVATARARCAAAEREVLGLPPNRIR